MANIRTILNLTPQALTAIDHHAPSPRKRGQFVSLAISEYARLLSEQEQGSIERLDTRLSNLQLGMNKLLSALGSKHK